MIRDRFSRGRGNVSEESYVSEIVSPKFSSFVLILAGALIAIHYLPVYGSVVSAQGNGVTQGALQVVDPVASQRPCVRSNTPT